MIFTLLIRIPFLMILWLPTRYILFGIQTWGGLNADEAIFDGGLDAVWFGVQLLILWGAAECCRFISKRDYS